MAYRRNKAPIHFLPDHCDEVKAIVGQGLAPDVLCKVFDISPQKMKTWRKMYPDFDRAVTEGQLLADAKVVESLYRRAVGYDYSISQESKVTGKTTLRAVHLPPDLTAIKFWLTNRRRVDWTDRKVLDVNVSLGERLASALARISDGSVSEGEFTELSDD